MSTSMPISFAVAENSSERILSFARAFEQAGNHSTIVVSVGELNGKGAVGIRINDDGYALLPEEARLVADTFSQAMQMTAERWGVQEASETLEGIGVPTMILALRHAADEAEVLLDA